MINIHLPSTYGHANEGGVPISSAPAERPVCNAGSKNPIGVATEGEEISVRTLLEQWH